MRLCVIVISALLCCSCSSTITSWKNRSVSKHSLMYPSNRGGDIFVLTGERRMAFAIPENANFKFCPESLPDAAAGTAASSELSKSKTETDKLTLNDQFAMNLLQTFNRTENAELFRQWNFAACSFWAQNAFADPKLAELFEIMTKATAAMMQKNAEKSTGNTAATGAKPNSSLSPTSED